MELYAPLRRLLAGALLVLCSLLALESAALAQVTGVQGKINLYLSGVPITGLKEDKENFKLYELNADIEIPMDSDLHSLAFNATTNKLHFFFSNPKSARTDSFSLRLSPALGDGKDFTHAVNEAIKPQLDTSYNIRFDGLRTNGPVSTWFPPEEATEFVIKLRPETFALLAVNIVLTRPRGSEVQTIRQRLHGTDPRTRSLRVGAVRKLQQRDLDRNEFNKLITLTEAEGLTGKPQLISDYFENLFLSKGYPVKVAFYNEHSRPYNATLPLSFTPTSDSSIAELLKEATDQNPTLNRWYFKPDHADKSGKFLPTIVFQEGPAGDWSPDPEVILLNYADPHQTAQIIRELFGREGVTVEVYGGEQLNMISGSRGTFKALFEGNLGTASQDLGVDIDALKDDIGGTSPVRAVIVRTQTEKQLVQIKRNIIRKLDVPPQMVCLDVQVYEISEHGLSELGLKLGQIDEVTGEFSAGQQFAFVEQSNPSGADRFEALTLGKFRRDGSLNIHGVLRALEEQGGAELLVNTTLSTVNGKQAHYFVGKEVPYPFVAAETGVLVEGARPKEVGVQLNFVPRIFEYTDKETGTRRNMVNVHVRPVVSSVTGFMEVGSLGARVPEIATRQSESILNLDSCEPYLLGRLISEEELTRTSKVPLLGDLPLVGKLFRNKHKTKDHVHVCILVTPHFDCNCRSTKKHQRIDHLSRPARSAGSEAEGKRQRDELPMPYRDGPPQAEISRVDEDSAGTIADVAPVDLDEIDAEEIDPTEIEDEVFPEVPTYRSDK